MRPTNPVDRIFVALDVASLDAALRLAGEVAPWVGGFKVGMEVLYAVGAPQVMAALRGLGRPIFLDGKFHDIPNTVAGAVRAVAPLGATFVNVHACGGRAMMEAAVKAAGARQAPALPGRAADPKDLRSAQTSVLAVTVLTSLTVPHLQEMGLAHVTSDAALQDWVVTLARAAQAAGCVGVVASPREIAAIRAACGADFLIVTPGVRPTWAAANDQSRVMTPREAIEAGADYVVIGRPITAPPADIGSPAEAARRIAEELI